MESSSAHVVRVARRAFAWFLLSAVLNGIAFGAEALRVAVLDFERAGAAGSMEPALADFSRAVQIRLLSDPNYAWVERQELDRILQEAGRAGLIGSDPTDAVRLGGLMHANLLVRGEIAERNGSGELTFQVIDLKRADFLAERTVPVGIAKNRRLTPTAAEISRAATAVLAALEESVATLQQRNSRRVIAPLYFKNISRTQRLNYVEEKLAKALAHTAAEANGFYVLRFPQRDPASGESELVMSGLTDHDPDAWQHVADAYVWATVEERGKDGDAFETVPVEIAVQVWNGFGPPRETKWTGPVQAIDQGVQSVMTEALQQWQPAPAGAPLATAERDRIAEALLKRASEINSRIHGSQFKAGEVVAGVSQEDYAKSEAGQRWIAHRWQLLEVASFLKPLDAQTRMSLEMRPPSRRSVGYSSMSAVLRRVQQGVANQGTDSADGEAELRLAKDVEALHAAACGLESSLLVRESLSRPTWYQDGPAMTAEELRAIRGQAEKIWPEQMRRAFARNRAPASGANASPPWVEEVANLYVRNLRYFLLRVDTIQARRLLEETWPTIRTPWGRLLRESAGNLETDYVVNCVLGIYDAFGEPDRAIALLDEAWRLSAPKAEPSPGTTPPLPAGKNTPPRPPQDKPRIPAPTSVAAMTGVVREIEPWPRAVLEQSPAAKRKQPVRIVDEMVWHQNRLWIAESATAPLPPESSLKNPEGDHFLWAYDPATGRTEFATARLASHTTIRAMASEGKNLWLGFDGAGIWRWEPDTADGKLRRFGGEDGLITLRVSQALVENDQLYFLGGESRKPVIARYERASGAWKGIDKVEGGGGAFAPSVRSRSMAVFGEWIGYADGQPTFYTPAAGNWRRLARPLILPPGTVIQDSPVFYASVISADNSGFWLGRENLIRQLDPRTPAKQRDLPIPGTPVAMAHDGRWLWILAEERLLSAGAAEIATIAKTINGVPPEPEKPTKLVVVDKQSFQCRGVMTLPSLRMRKLVLANGRIWIGGSSILEVTPTIPELTAVAANGEGKVAVSAGEKSSTVVALPSPSAPVRDAAKPEQSAEPEAAAWRLPQSVLIYRRGAGRSDGDKITAAEQKLIAACQTGDLAAAKQAVAEGAEFNCRNESGITPLCQALRSKHPEMVRWLVDQGASLNYPTKAANFPLNFAVDGGQANMMDFLLAEGADINAHGEGMTALTVAAQRGQLDLAKKLLAAGANPNLCDGGKGTFRQNPLAVALEEGNEPMTQLLLAAGANPRANFDGFYANWGEQAMRHANNSLLMYAAKGGNVTLLRKMISLGQDPRERSESGYDALTWAARTGRKDAVVFLLPLSAREGAALEQAEVKGFPEIAALLRAAGYQPR